MPRTRERSADQALARVDLVFDMYVLDCEQSLANAGFQQGRDWQYWRMPNFRCARCELVFLEEIEGAWNATEPVRRECVEAGNRSHSTFRPLEKTVQMVALRNAAARFAPSVKRSRSST